MRLCACLMVLFLCSPIFVASAKEKKDTSAKKSVKDTVTVTGSVTKLKSHMTVLYHIGETTVARGSVKHLKNHVGKDVSATCVVKNDRIIRIESVNVLGDTPDPLKTGQIAFRHLTRLYKDDPSKTIKKYRNVDMQFSGTATSIRNYSSEEYQVNLDKSRGKVIIPKADLTVDLKKKLWDLMKSKTDKVDISFSGKWAGTEVNAIVIKDVNSLTEKAASKPAKNKKNNKKKKK